METQKNLEGSIAMSANNITAGNVTAILAPEMHFTSANMLSIVAYSVLMVFSALGNTTVLAIILRRRDRVRSRINTMLMHLAIADLLVTFLMMPLEIAWAATVSWWAGDAMCRIMAFFRVFGLFLSSFVLVCISIDRYFAILKPMSLSDVDRRGRLMLIGAWVCSFLCSLPQAVVFHVEVHPNHTWYEQCITFTTFGSDIQEVLYALFGMMLMYVLPLAVFIFSYVSILAEIFRRSKETGGDVFRRSSLGFLGRAKTRTLKMAITIVLVFFVCWTPYNIVSVWHLFDKESALQVDYRIRRVLYIFACTNSCMNPIVYGAFNFRTQRHGGQVRSHNTFSSTERVAPPWSHSQSTQKTQFESDMSSQLEESPNGNSSPRHVSQLQGNGCSGTNGTHQVIELIPMI